MYTANKPKINPVTTTPNILNLMSIMGSNNSHTKPSLYALIRHKWALIYELILTTSQEIPYEHAVVWHQSFRFQPCHVKDSQPLPFLDMFNHQSALKGVLMSSLG